MINYVTGTDLWLYPDLARTMFVDRATQFSKRLGWPVFVDNQGYERDEYDRINPIYVIVSDNFGHHSGSMRLLPTTGATMINDVFAPALDGGRISDPSVWECTRFCLSPAAGPRTAAKLFASAGRLMHELQVQSLIAVFDRLMLRKYRISGVSPEILGDGNVAGASVMTGRWQFSHAHLSDLMRLADLDPLECELALANSSLMEARDRRYA